MTSVRGRVRAGGVPLPGCDVLLLSADGASLLGHATAEADGTFSVPAPDPESTALVLAKSRDDPIGLASAKVEPPFDAAVELALDQVGPLWPLTVLAAGEDVPAELELRLTPRRIDGFPTELLRWVFVRDAGVSESTLAVRHFRDGRAEQRVQAGRWLLGASYEEAVNARAFDTEPKLWFTAGAALESGEELPGDLSGYEVEVQGPLVVVLRIESAVD